MSLGDATEGACGSADCQLIWILFMAMCIFGLSLLGSGLVANILISIRSVLLQDKAIALALELTFVGLTANIPGKIVYQLISGFSF